MEFENKVVVITGGARGIGRAMAELFRKKGARVCIIDLLENDDFVGDLADKATLERFAEKVLAEHGRVDILVNNAAPLMTGITEGSYEDFEYALRGRVYSEQADSTARFLRSRMLRSLGFRVFAMGVSPFI